MKFRTALILLNLHLEELDILFLINKYRHSNDQVNYADFCSNINGVFENQDFQNSLLSKMTHMVLLIEKDAQLAGILDSFRNEIMTRRLTLKPSFQDFDKTNCSKITIDQVPQIWKFTRVLKKLELVPPEPAYRKLVSYYGENAREINYVKFCEAIDDTQE